MTQTLKRSAVTATCRRTSLLSLFLFLLPLLLLLVVHEPSEATGVKVPWGYKSKPPRGSGLEAIYLPKAEYGYREPSCLNLLTRRCDEFQKLERKDAQGLLVRPKKDYDCFLIYDDDNKVWKCDEKEERDTCQATGLNLLPKPGGFYYVEGKVSVFRFGRFRSSKRLTAFCEGKGYILKKGLGQETYIYSKKADEGRVQGLKIPKNAEFKARLTIPSYLKRLEEGENTVDPEKVKRDFKKITIKMTVDIEGVEMVAGDIWVPKIKLVKEGLPDFIRHNLRLKTQICGDDHDGCPTSYPLLWILDKEKKLSPTEELCLGKTTVVPILLNGNEYSNQLLEKKNGDTFDGNSAFLACVRGGEGATVQRVAGFTVPGMRSV